MKGKWKNDAKIWDKSSEVPGRGWNRSPPQLLSANFVFGLYSVTLLKPGNFRHPASTGSTCKTPLCSRRDKNSSIPSWWSAFFQKDICQQTAPSGSLDGLKGGAYATGRQMLCGQKRPRSLPVNSTVKGDHILSPHTVMYWFCLWLLRFQYSRDCQSCSVLCSKDSIVAGQSCCLGPDEWLSIILFWLKGQRTQGFFSSLVLPFFPIPVNLIQSDSIWFNLQHHSVRCPWPFRFTSDAGTNATFVRKSSARFWCLGSQKESPFGF